MKFLRTALAPFLAAAVGSAGCDLVAPPAPTPQVQYVVVTATPTSADGQPRPRPTGAAEPQSTKTPTVVLLRTPTALPTTPPPTQRLNPTATPRIADGGFRATALEKPPQDLFRSLLTTPFNPDEVPTGFTAGGIIVRDLDATTKAFNAVGRVEASFTSSDTIFGPTVPGQARNSSTVPGMAGIAYILFPTEQDAIAYSKTLLKQPNRTTNQVGRVVILAEKYGVYNSLQELQQTTERLGESAATHLARVLRQ